MIADIVVNGLLASGIYALLAVGFALVFGVARIVNIAHTSFYMLAAYAIYTLLNLVGLPFLPSVLIGVVAVTLVSIVMYKLVIEPVRQHEGAVLIATIALALIFQEALLLAFGGHFRGNPTLAEGFIQIAGVRVGVQRVLTLAIVAVALVGTWLLLYRTRLGLAIRCTANDLEVANLMGMNVRRVAMLTIATSALLAAVAGAVVAPLFVIDPLMWLAPLVTMMAVVVLGGLGSIKGSVVGAFIIGYVETMTVFLVPAGAFLKGAVALTIMVIVLLVRPEGLFGVGFEEER